MAYTVVRKQYEDTPRRVMVMPSASRTVSVARRNYNSPVRSLRYIDDDGYMSDSPVIIQKPTPRTVTVLPQRRNSNFQSQQQQQYVVVQDSESDDGADDDTYYLIDGKYYKNKPVVNTVYKQKPYISPREPYVYMVDNNNNNNLQSEEEYYIEDDDEEDYRQKKVVLQKKAPPKQILYVDEDKPTFETPRILKVQPKYQPIVVKPNPVRSSARSIKSSQLKPLEKVLIKNRSKPRNNHRKEIETIEVKDKPLPNRNVIYGGSIVYK